MFYQNNCMRLIADGTKFKRIVRSVLSVILISFSINSHATNYYIAANGDDSNSGISPASPWKTLKKLNSFFRSLQPGDKVLFNKGDVFYGNIVISQSGRLDNPIIISSYGTGEKPVITGFTNVIAWTNIGNNIWESTGQVSSLQACNMVAINRVNTAKGRTPNKGVYYTIDSYETSPPYSITSNSINSSVVNWTGADIVIRKGYPGENKGLINSVSGSTINYTDYISQGAAHKAGFGFFINNDIRTLDVQNEWYYNPSTKKIDVYSTAMPTNLQVASISDIITGKGVDYVTIDGLTIMGADNDLISFTGKTDGITIKNCTLRFCGNNGIETIGSDVKDSIVNNTISDVGKAGAYLGGKTYMGYNTLHNIGVVHGQSNWGIRNNGLYCFAQNTTSQEDVVFEYNKIVAAGTNGIAFGSHTAYGRAQYNFVDSACLTSTDNGGIYKGGPGNKAILIDHNIVGNTVGYVQGTPNSAITGYNAVGIYLDEGTTNTVVTNNTSFNNGEDGLKLHSYTGHAAGVPNSNSNRVENNTFYNNKVAQILIQNNNSSLPMFADTVRYNIAFSHAEKQWTLNVNDQNNNISGLGVIDYNYYVRPMGNGNIIQTQTTNTSPRNLSAWQSLSGFDVHSVVTPNTITNINNLLFKYNATSSSVIINLSTNYVDALGKIYKGSVTLNPYSSVILIKQAP
jgi:parallel beta-helix repeat protein